MVKGINNKLRQRFLPAKPIALLFYFLTHINPEMCSQTDQSIYTELHKNVFLMTVLLYLLIEGSLYQ